MVEWMSGVDPTQSYGENTKSPIQISRDFAIKPIKMFKKKIFS